MRAISSSGSAKLPGVLVLGSVSLEFEFAFVSVLVGYRQCQTEGMGRCLPELQSLLSLAHGWTLFCREAGCYFIALQTRTYPTMRRQWLNLSYSCVTHSINEELYTPRVKYVTIRG